VVTDVAAGVARRVGRRGPGREAVVGTDPDVPALGLFVGGDGKDPLARAAVEDAVVPPLLAVKDTDALVERPDPDPAQTVYSDAVNVVGGGVFGGELLPCLGLGGIGLKV
jgi:hypothetical protein